MSGIRIVAGGTGEMEVHFGRLKQDIPRSEFRHKLENHESRYCDVLKSNWSRVPLDYQRRFKDAYHLRILDYVESGKEIRFSAEWDVLEPGSFRGKEFWTAATSYASIRLKHLENPWLVTVEGQWSVAPRVSRALLGVQGGISGISIPSGVLKTILDQDSLNEKYMWWSGVEDGVDGGLRGTLPKQTGFRSRFDRAGEPYFARFDSASLGCQISISCKGGYLSSRTLQADQIIRYFEQWILPNVKIQ